uniref:Putative plant transposon protein domain-containing protein n=1 Tax=Solanum tuberosum TaxID=4113 RepID=M1E0V1_SOLTU
MDNHPDVWNTLKFHKFEISTKLQVPYIPTWVREFYSTYRELVLKGKKKESAFKPLDFIVVRGKKVKCLCSDINVVLGCSLNIMHDYISLVLKKTLENLKSCLTLLISDVTRRWIEDGAPIEKNDLNVAAIY